ncbi:MAG: hypothetical protein PHW47_05795 [Lachnospira sp.]|nr:hypothetical protein [Lachnospira sp.]
MKYNNKNANQNTEGCESCKEIDYHEIIECITCALDARDTYTASC